MSVIDPIGDMLTRIRNAQERGKQKVATPASRLRDRVLDVLQQEGFIRGYATVQHGKRSRLEIEIELKYFDGEPVIHEIHRVSKPGRRVYASVGNSADRLQRPWHFHTFDAEGRYVRCRSPRPECGWRGALHGILRKGRIMSRIGKKPVPVPTGVTVNVAGQNVSVKGTEGRAQDGAGRSCVAKMENGQVKVDPRDETKLARSCWGMSRTMIANMIKGVTEGYSRSLEINGVGYRAAAQGRTLQLNLGYSHDVVYPVPEGMR